MASRCGIIRAAMLTFAEIKGKIERAWAAGDTHVNLTMEELASILAEIPPDALAQWHKSRGEHGTLILPPTPGRDGSRA